MSRISAIFVFKKCQTKFANITTCFNFIRAALYLYLLNEFYCMVVLTISPRYSAGRAAVLLGAIDMLEAKTRYESLLIFHSL